MSEGESIYQFRELMLICNGCGGERMVPQEVVDKILSADDLKAFTSGPIMQYACRCPKGTHCDIRIKMSEAGEAALKKQP